MTDDSNTTNPPADTPALTPIEADQSAAIAISNWLRERLSAEGDNERRIRRAADIMDMVLWWISGPGWGRSITEASDDTTDDQIYGERVVRLFPPGNFERNAPNNEGEPLPIN